jgi:hypothetical protein
VPRLEIALGRTLGSATVALIQGSIVFLVCLAAEFRPAHPVLLPLALLFMTLIAIMCTAIGTAVGSVLQDMQGFQLIINFLVLPLFFFSSALFPGAGPPGGDAARRAPQPAQLGRRRPARRSQRRLRLRCRDRFCGARRPRRNPARDRRAAATSACLAHADRALWRDGLGRLSRASCSSSDRAFRLCASASGSSGSFSARPPLIWLELTTGPSEQAGCSRVPSGIPNSWEANRLSSRRHAGRE